MSSTPEPENPLSTALERARRGLRRDVSELLDAIRSGELIVPLSRDVPGAEEGERVEFSGNLELHPHLIADEERQHYAVLFSESEIMEPVARELEWTTDGEELKGCTLPAMLACEMALDAIDEQRVFGLVFNPGHESELFLRRSELASILSGQPIPLVGYLGDLPPLEDERILVAEGTGLDPAIASDIERALSSEPRVSSHRLERTFNPERDLEPHPTLTLVVGNQEVDRKVIAEKVIAAVGDRLPPPGYLDIVFEEPED